MIKKIVKNHFPKLYRVAYKLFVTSRIATIKTDNYDSHIQYLQTIDASRFKEVEFLQSDLILRLGLSSYMPSLPLGYHAYRGGLQLMQVPEQFAEFLAFIATQELKSYLEIGVNAGGTFITVCEVLQKTNPNFERALGIDICNVPNLGKYCRTAPKFHFEAVASNTADFKSYLAKKGWNQFDLIFIDGDHSYAAALSDYQLALTLFPKIIVFHDIVDYLCGDLVQLWDEIVASPPKGYVTKAITAQSIDARASIAGIGLLVKQ